MKLLTLSISAILGLASALVASAQTSTVLDNFDEYTSGAGYIPGASNNLTTAQQGTNGKWLRFGSAVSDGLYSSAAAGNSGRGAVADAAFAIGSATLYIPEFYLTSADDLSTSGSTAIDLDIKVSTALAGLSAAIQIQDSTGSQYESAFQSLASDTAYTTFAFDFSPGDTTNTVSDGDSLATVLTGATEINIVYKDTTDTASPAIDFDNLVNVAPASVPEPASTASIMLAGAASLVVMRSRGRKSIS